ncbi:MAG TPA: hypothetical protein VK203_07785 [Nostocaceae cyanobacterium]|nr:hypothetical protein [Nostocaceae cyanobacterium]
MPYVSQIRVLKRVQPQPYCPFEYEEIRNLSEDEQDRYLEVLADVRAKVNQVCDEELNRENLAATVANLQLQESKLRQQISELRQTVADLRKQRDQLEEGIENKDNNINAVSPSSNSVTEEEDEDNVPFKSSLDPKDF